MCRHPVGEPMVIMMCYVMLCCAVLCSARGPDLGLGPEKVRREIQLQARLDHVNIVELKQVGKTYRALALLKNSKSQLLVALVGIVLSTKGQHQHQSQGYLGPNITDNPFPSSSESAA